MGHRLKNSLFYGTSMKILRKFKFWLAGGTVSVLFFGLFLLAVSNSSTGTPVSGSGDTGAPVAKFMTLFLLGLITGGSGTVLWIKFGKKPEAPERISGERPEEHPSSLPQTPKTHRPPWRFPWE
ncbi:MAG TPA: hypothetical protein VLB09_02245 [Nitrospiria bacterium]|nr:hypothetical protein [Nitrospiria bacterium]